MPKHDIAEATKKVITILAPLEEDERSRVMNAALILLGHSPNSAKPKSQPGISVPVEQDDVMTSQHFFAAKQPRSKMEEIAVAARYRESFEGADSSTAAEIEKVFLSARRNFDKNNFRRDLDNAKTKGLFVRNTGRDSIQLAYKGQQFVDALPNREIVSISRPPKKPRRDKI